MGVADRQSSPTSSDGSTRPRCPQCGRSLAPESSSCPACSDLGGPTVRDNVHDVATAILSKPASDGTHDVTTVRRSPDDLTLLGGRVLPVPTARKLALPGVSAASRSDAGLDVDTPWVPPKMRAPPLTKTREGSSDPPTRFMRNIDQHIELPDGSMVDDFEIEAKLGAGAMGVVYRARHTRLGRRVAIKVIAPSMGSDPQALARFEREARALASLHHPNIVDVSAFGALPDERSYFVMEYLVGEALDEHLARTRPMFDDALDILDQMARALEAAHAQGIVHRDLKPANTFLVRIPGERRPIAKLLDFGLAKLAVADGVEKTASGAVIGTALYISPEQARGPDVDRRTDVYALGCIAYELVLGRHPFPGLTTPTAAIAAHLTEPPPLPRSLWPDIPPALDVLLLSMLAKAPSHRPSLAHVRHVIAEVRAPSATPANGARAATELVFRDAAGSSLRRVTPRMIAVVAAIGIGIGVLARACSEDAAPPTSSPTKPISTAPPAPLEPAPRPDIVRAPAPAPASTPEVAPTPTADPPKPPPRKHATVTPVDAAVPDALVPDATAASDEPDASPPPDDNVPVTPASSEPPATAGPEPEPPVIKRPAPRPVPRVPKKLIDRNTTINPFR